MKKILSICIMCIMLISFVPAAQAGDYISVYAPDGRCETIKTEDFAAWHAVGWYSKPVMYVYAPDGRSQLIVKSDYSAWNAVGWYNAPVMYAYNTKGETILIYTAEFNKYHSKGWYSEPVMYVYARDGRKQLIVKRDAAAWKAVGWDYQTGYADNIPWTSDKQVWAIIDLTCGPYKSWQQNRNYYINKYFIEMPEADRLNIKHYSKENHGRIEYLIVPRFKTAVTITAPNGAYFSNGYTYYQNEPTVCTVQNGMAFTTEIPLPAGDINPLFAIKDNVGNNLLIHQEFQGIGGSNLRAYELLDLTEWKYY
ncbi:MAG: hypothetical protein IKJ68_04075 [Clostridia bacterium]|nr:hypothetical protein [Clostridia bacterium]